MSAALHHTQTFSLNNRTHTEKNLILLGKKEKNSKRPGKGEEVYIIGGRLCASKVWQKKNVLIDCSCA